MHCGCRQCWTARIYLQPIDDKEAPKGPFGKKTTAKKRKNKILAAGSTFKLQNQENITQMDGLTKSDSLEELDKHRSKCKKNRNFSPPAKSIADHYSNPPKTVTHYSPLTLHVQLELEPCELYYRFMPYILFTEQLKRNGFPLESLTDPGKAVFYNKRYPGASNNNERICSRCDEKFTVSDDGKYQSETTECRYHSGRRQALGDIYNAGAYSCCGNAVSSRGCASSKQHVSAQVCMDGVDFVKTRVKRQHSSYRVYALDCEMSYTVRGLEVTRISVVGTDGLAVYDSYVVPDYPIIDYNTTYSGITANDLKGVKTTLADVQAFLLKLLTAGTVLVGHGLENDLRALHLIHERIVDTSVVFPNPTGSTRKMSLKALAAMYLEKTIQGPHGHDSVEDARTCMELMLCKIQKDNQTYVPPHQRVSVTIPPTQPWPRSSLSINPVLMPYNTCNVGFFVPPVGSSCDLY